MNGWSPSGGAWRRRVGALALAALLAPAASARDPDLAQELARIDRVQRSAAWPESQPMIDRLRARMDGASVNERASLALMEGSNRLVAGEFEQALAAADDVLSQPVQPPVRLQAWRLGANALSALQRYARAFEYVAEALRLADRIDSSADRAGVHALAARMHAEAGESALGLKYAVEALRLAESSGEPTVICDAWISLLRAQTEAGMIALALDGTQTLWQRCQQAGDPERVAYSLTAIGRMHLADGNHPAAIGWLERGLEAQREARMQIGRIDNELVLARAYLADRQPAAARARLDTVLPALRDSANVVDLGRARLLISDVLAALGEYAAALEQLDAYRSLPDQPEQQRRQQQLAYLQVDFENQRRAQQLELLRRQQRIAEQEAGNRAARERRQRWSIGLGVVALVLMAGLLMKLRRERRRLKRLTRVDGLTELLNHRAFHDEVAGRLDADRGRNRGLNRGLNRGAGTLVAADVDLFKRVNDRYGHQAGDAVLRALGATLREQFPPPCVIGRVGGEEFAIWLPEHNRLQARQRIGALRQALRPVEFRGQPISCTLSFGLIEVRGDARLEHLRIQADRALYRAKRAGRDEIVDAGDLVSSY